MTVPEEKDREVVKPVVLKVRINSRQLGRWEARAKQQQMPLLEWLIEAADWDARTW